MKSIQQVSPRSQGFKCILKLGVHFPYFCRINFNECQASSILGVHDSFLKDNLIILYRNAFFYMPTTRNVMLKNEDMNLKLQHMMSKHHCINVNVTSWRHIAVDTTLFQGCVLAGCRPFWKRNKNLNKTFVFYPQEMNTFSNSSMPDQIHAFSMTSLMDIMKEFSDISIPRVAIGYILMVSHYVSAFYIIITMHLFNIMCIILDIKLWWRVRASPASLCCILEQEH